MLGASPLPFLPGVPGAAPAALLGGDEVFPLRPSPFPWPALVTPLLAVTVRAAAQPAPPRCFAAVAADGCLREAA